MDIGIPKEIKNHEYRVGATPSVVRALSEAGHTVFVEGGAGEAIGFTNEMYRAAGATILNTPEEVYSHSMIIKVKEPQKKEFSLLKREQILFCFLHLAPDPEQTEALVKSGVIAIAYETITDAHGRLPLLTPMSEIAGRLSIQVGASCLQMNYGGKGLLLGGTIGVPPARVLIIGGGVAGTEAARIAVGMGADVTLIDKDLSRLRTLDIQFSSRIKTLYSTTENIEKSLLFSDLVVGAVLVPGKTAPKLISKQMIRMMTPGSVIVDISIDQGGCFETSRPTTHENPTYTVEGITHYCVTNMPGACARTATEALTNATLRYILEIANKGWQKALKTSGLQDGLNVCLGHVTNPHVAADLGYPYVPPSDFNRLLA